MKNSWKFNSEQKFHPFLAPAFPSKQYTELQEALSDGVADDYNPESDRDSFFGADRPPDSVQDSVPTPLAEPEQVRLPSLSLQQAHSLVKLVCEFKHQDEPDFMKAGRQASADDLTRWLSRALKKLL